jgi:hypothetical protein
VNCIAYYHNEIPACKDYIPEEIKSLLVPEKEKKKIIDKIKKKKKKINWFEYGGWVKAKNLKLAFYFIERYNPYSGIPFMIGKKYFSEKQMKELYIPADPSKAKRRKK